MAPSFFTLFRQGKSPPHRVDLRSPERGGAQRAPSISAAQERPKVFLRAGPPTPAVAEKAGDAFLARIGAKDIAVAKGFGDCAEKLLALYPHATVAEATRSMKA
jgi:hypothetical protein